MTRKPLGRGLDALIGSTEAQAENAQTDGANGPNPNGAGPALLMVAPERITPSPLQPRRYFNPEALEELITAIKSQGMIEPLIVRTAPKAAEAGRYELIAGERRLRAAREAGLAAVPVIVRELDDRAALEMSLVENLLREDLNAIEEGRAFIRLAKEFTLTHEEIAARIGKSRPYVTNIIRLMELPLPVIEMIGRGELTGGQVRPLLALNSPDAQIAEARKIAEGKISSRRAEEIASAQRSVQHGGRNATRVGGGGDPNLEALAHSIQRALKRKVKIVKQRGKKPGRLELEYYDDDDLTGLANMLTNSGRGSDARLQERV
jgi:ParB family transcriptional regulator, chromosome partitioning protein